LNFATIFVLQNKIVSLASNFQPGGAGPSIYVPQYQDSPVSPQALGSLFVAFYDSQGYGGGILTRLDTGNIECNAVKQTLLERNKRLISFGTTSTV
jgi:hypothetical protein